MLTTPEQFQKKKFLNGEYSPAEGRDIISHLMMSQINFQKLQYLARREAGHSTTTDLNISGATDLKLVEKGNSGSI